MYVKSLWAYKIIGFNNVHLEVYIIVSPRYGQTTIQKLHPRILSHDHN
jgi:hypothetical protein